MIHGLFVLLEQLGNNLIFTLEMVIKITRTDVHFVGYVYCCGAGLALLIKQRKARMEYAIPGFHG